MLSSALNGITAYEDNNEKRYTAIEILKINDNQLTESLGRVIKNAKNKLTEIKKMISDIPETFNGIQIMSKLKKEYYIKTFEIRLDYLKNIYKNQNNA